MGKKAAPSKRKPAVAPYAVSYENRARVEHFLNTAQNALRLQDWTIDIDWSKQCSRSALATISDVPDSKHGTITLSSEFFELSLREQNQTLLHELMHCHLFAVQRLAEESMLVAGSKSANQMFNVAYTAAIESTVDALADVLVDLV